MDLQRFAHLLDAYGGDLGHWPANERAAAAVFAAENKDAIAPLVAEARALDAALAPGREDVPVSAALAARIRAVAPPPRRADHRAMLALAACAAFGMVLGYGGGLLAPQPDPDDSYFSMALEGPFGAYGDEG